MTTAVDVQRKTTEATPEVKAIHRRMLRRQRLGRATVYLVGILISLWVLIPIWFIASMALTTPAEVRSYPKGILPFIPLSLETMQFFLNSRGILPGLRIVLNNYLCRFFVFTRGTAGSNCRLHCGFGHR